MLRRILRVDIAELLRLSAAGESRLALDCSLACWRDIAHKSMLPIGVGTRPWPEKSYGDWLEGLVMLAFHKKDAPFA